MSVAGYRGHLLLLLLRLRVRPLDLDYINSNNKRCKEKESAELHFAKRNRVITEELENSHPGNNYKIFSELEAIYKPDGSNSTATEPVNIKTTGSGSALTGDDHPLIAPVTTAKLTRISRKLNTIIVVVGAGDG
ncbi:hypothetical protein MA16_Dca016209 [Dendrobium catenatum]|uniref:Uncharacterized protein n=1 Tax=Dendrobium catenatum TaxID=906689 RepID=A0A2I0WBX1_9ASPA|nr:hypothetical protein MA16_Dca016209 [Dendrobium catenatum]